MHNDGSGGFTENASFGMITTEGVQQVAAADYDNDGDRDFYLIQDGAANLMIANDGALSDLATSPLDHGGAGRSGAWGDFDNDQDLDLYLVNEDEENVLFKSRGNGNFDEASEGVCPFCQQSTTEAFAQSLNEYFDEAFETDTVVVEFLK